MAAILAGADQLSPEAIGVARIGLANYFAGAFLLPYKQFHHAAESSRYDVDILARQFEVGHETVCHRLSTLQRPSMRGFRLYWCAPIEPEISRNVSLPPHFTSPGLVETARCGWCTRRSRTRTVCHPGGRDARWPHLFLGGSDQQHVHRWISQHPEVIRDRIGLRYCACAPAGVLHGNRNRRSIDCCADRAGLQGVCT